MKAARHDEATAGRINSLSLAFRELLQTRMLWAASGVAVIGIMGGLIFFNGQADVPLQNQADTAPETAIIQPETTAVTDSMNEETPLAVAPGSGGAVLAGSSCDSVAQQAAAAARDRELQAELDRYEKAKRAFGLRQLLAGHDRDYEAAVNAINARYQTAVIAAHCSSE